MLLLRRQKPLRHALRRGHGRQDIVYKVQSILMLGVIQKYETLFKTFLTPFQFLKYFNDKPTLLVQCLY